MGDVIFAKTVGQGRRGSDGQPPHQPADCFEPFEPAQFGALSEAIRASAEQLEAIALKAFIHGGSAESQEAFAMMMLGPLAALDKLRRRIMRT